MKIGRMSGNVTERKTRVPLAPSIRADSWSSAGTVIRAE